MCIHELSECAYCPSRETFARRAEAVRALMARPAQPTVARQKQVVPVVLPVPSTDEFTSLAVGYQSASFTYTKQVPRLEYPHWTVSTEVQPLRGMAEHYERSIYGEITHVGQRARY